MNKNVLILSASPRRGGNSDLLCDQFLKGALSSGNQVEKIFLRDYKISYCLGCGVCNRTHHCVQNDDMIEILEKMVAADVLVMATPVYFYTMDAQMKTLIDRTVPLYTRISNKDFYFIMTAADTSEASMERTLEGFRGFTDCLSSAKERGVVYGTGVWQIGEVQSTKAMDQAYEFGKEV